MFRQRFLIVWFTMGVLLLSLFSVSSANAQEPEPTPENDANCVSCHEHRYYLYDTGNWYCLCEAPMHCVYCHGGRTDSYVEDIAHEGMVLYPTREQAERCQACHGEDYMERVARFDSVAGISATPEFVITATPYAAVIASVKEPPAASLLRLSQLEPWRLIGLGALAVILVGLVIFGYRCWKLDCISRRQFL